MRASRGAPRTPLPMRSATRTTSTCHGAVAIATSGRTALANAYPKSTSGFRRSSLSDSAPDASFSKLATVSAAPSTSPRNSALAPSVSARKIGSSGKIISEPASVKKLVSPRSRTVIGSRRDFTHTRYPFNLARTRTDRVADVEVPQPAELQIVGESRAPRVARRVLPPITQRPTAFPPPRPRALLFFCTLARWGSAAPHCCPCSGA